MTSAAIAVLAWIRLRDLNYLPFFIAQKRDFYDPPYARRGIDYYLKNKVYAANGEVAMTGLKINIEVQAQDGVLKQPLPPPERYVDLSYLRQGAKGTGGRKSVGSRSRAAYCLPLSAYCWRLQKT